jgi:hypothetical protein
MVEGWQNGIINANTGYNMIRRNPAELAWTNRAITSTGIEPVSRNALTLEQLPPALQDHITKVGLPTYQEMVALGG